MSYLAEYVNAKVSHSPQMEIKGVGSIQNAVAGQITFLANSRYRHHLNTTSASAVILEHGEQDNCPVPTLICDHPYLAFARICALFTPVSVPEPGIHKTATVATGCKLGEGVSVGPGVSIGANCTLANNCVIGPNCTLGKNCVLGSDCRLTANVVLGDDTRLGCNVLIHPGAVIGADGFGLVTDENGQWVKIPQCGKVVLGDHVEIGANTTIDRGTIEDTVLENDVRVDNQVQIAHNVHIGAHTAIAGCVGIAGSTRIGKRCKIAGGAGIAGHIEITDDVIISAVSMVTKSIRESGVCTLHSPMYNTQRWIRIKSRVSQIEKLIRGNKRSISTDDSEGEIS